MEIGKKPVVVVSGGNGYIGSEIVKFFEKNGWTAVALSRQPGSSQNAWKCDVGDEGSVASISEQIIQEFGEIDALVHAASSQGKEPLETQLKVARDGAQFLSRMLLPHVKKGGAFVGITTKFLSDDVEPPPLHAYIEAKKALHDYLVSLKHDAVFDHVRIFEVAPGYLPGGLNKDVPKEMLEFLAVKSNAGMTSKEAVADLVYRLVSDPATEGGMKYEIPEGKVSSL